MPPATAGASAAASAASSAARAREHLLRLLEPVVSEAGYDLEDVTVTSAGRRSLVRVIVDADGGIDLDAVADVSRRVSDALDSDSSDPQSPRALAGAYVLEVSSPGVDRPLTEPRHWRRAIGRLVKVEVGGSTLLGRIVEVAETTGVTFDVAGHGSRTVGWTELGKGRVQVEFNRHDGGAGEGEIEGEGE
jgi:ribosome maturation factor RimP